MKRLPALTLAVVSSIVLAGPYEDCILKNMKGVQAQAAAGAIMRACKEKTTPKKCRADALKSRFVDLEPAADKDKKPWDGLVNKPNFFDQFDVDACLKECAEANYWSRTFGECSTD